MLIVKANEFVGAGEVFRAVREVLKNPKDGWLESAFRSCCRIDGERASAAASSSRERPQPSAAT